MLADVRRRHKPAAAAMRDMIAHNEAVIDGKPITEKEFAERDRIRESSGSFDDCYREELNVDAGESSPRSESGGSFADIYNNNEQ